MPQPTPTASTRPPAPPSLPPKPPPRMAPMPSNPAAAPKRDDIPDQPGKAATPKREVSTKPKAPTPAKSTPAKNAKPTAVKADKSDKPVKRQQEIDPSKLEREKATKRLSRIYALEKIRDRKKAANSSAMKAARATKAELEQAEEDLTNEIQAQRFGPGPLFNSDGSGPAGTPQAGGKS